MPMLKSKKSIQKGGDTLLVCPSDINGTIEAPYNTVMGQGDTPIRDATTTVEFADVDGFINAIFTEESKKTALKNFLTTTPSPTLVVLYETIKRIREDNTVPTSVGGGKKRKTGSKKTSPKFIKGGAKKSSKRASKKISKKMSKKVSNIQKAGTKKNLKRASKKVSKKVSKKASKTQKIGIKKVSKKISKKGSKKASRK